MRTGPGGRIPTDQIVKLDAMEDLDKDLLTLEADLHVGGWDQPARLYTIEGKEGDYRLEYLSEVHNHPVDELRSAVLAGRHLAPAVPASVKGVALAFEGWRHACAEDLEVHHPQWWQGFLRRAEAQGFNTNPDDKVSRVALMDFINEALDVIAENMSPAQSPVHIEMRSVVVMMADGRARQVVRIRNGEPDVGVVADGGRLTNAMRALLDGKWPDDPDMQ